MKTNVIYVIIVILAMPLMSINIQAKSRYYVNSDGGSDNNTGTSWNNAFATLTKAFTLTAEGDEIWVAAGTYIGAYTLSKHDFKLYGSFAGTETSPVLNNVVLGGKNGD